MALGLLAGGFIACAVWARQMADLVSLGAPPFVGEWRMRVPPAVLIPVAIGALVVWKGRAIAAEVPWRSMLAIAFVVSVGWGVAIALIDGTGGLMHGIAGPFDHLADLDRVAAPGPFLRDFTSDISSYTVHVRGHPPGLLVALWWMDRLGLDPVVWEAGTAIVASGVAVVAALVALREVAGPDAARGAAPFLVVAPAAIWAVTSADAIYAALGAIAVALLVVSTGRRGVRSDSYALGGGLVLGAGLFVSYGLVLIGIVPVVVALARRRFRPLVIGGIGVAIVAAVFALFGFWWFDGLEATRHEYVAGVGGSRPQAYFVLANLAVFGAAIGPAPVAGLALLRDRRTWLLVGAGVACVLLADASGLSKGEVERIWLPFWPWLGLAAAALAASRLGRWLLVGQATVAIALQVTVRSPW